MNSDGRYQEKRVPSHSVAEKDAVSYVEKAYLVVLEHLKNCNAARPLFGECGLPEVLVPFWSGAGPGCQDCYGPRNLVDAFDPSFCGSFITAPLRSRSSNPQGRPAGLLRHSSGAAGVPGAEGCQR